MYVREKSAVRRPRSNTTWECIREMLFEGGQSGRRTFAVGSSQHLAKNVGYLSKYEAGR